MSSATKLTPDNISFKIGKKIDINTIEELELSSLGYIDATSSFSRLKCLKKLDLSSNRFQLIRNIKGLFDLPTIEDLNLSGNPISKQSNYRLIIIQNLPSLLILDGKKITGDERNQAKEFDVNAVKDPLKKNVDIDDDEDDDIGNKKVEEKVEKKVETKNIVNEEEEEKSKKLDEDSLFGSNKTTHKKLVFEDDEEISLDSINLSSLEKKPVAEKKQSKLIFEDEDDDDELFGKGSSTVKKTNNNKKSTTTDFDDDLFGDSNSNSNSNLSSDFDISNYINSQKQRTKGSLFD